MYSYFLPFPPVFIIAIEPLQKSLHYLPVIIIISFPPLDIANKNANEIKNTEKNDY